MKRQLNSFNEESYFRRAQREYSTVNHLRQAHKSNKMDCAYREKEKKKYENLPVHSVDWASANYPISLRCFQ